MTPTRVAFVASSASRFVEIDRRLLSEAFSVRRVRWRGKRSIPRLVWAVLRSDVTFSWFALDHAYGAARLARLFGKKSIVVVGGVDAAQRPDLGYGVFLNPVMASRTRYVLANSDRVLVVEDALKDEIKKNAGIAREDVLTVPLGFDVETFSPGNGPRTYVLTVAIIDETNVRRKGLDVLLEVARQMPEQAFVVVGGRANDATRRLRESAPPNLRILDSLSDAELLEAYRTARIYLQISRYEAFGSSLGEAMACGCIPVGTRVGGIATLIDAVGFFAPIGDVAGTVEAIRQAQAKGDGKAARARIAEVFPLERRKEALIQIVRDSISS